MAASGPDGGAAALDASAFPPLKPSKQLMKDFIIDQNKFSLLPPIFVFDIGGKEEKEKRCYWEVENRGILGLNFWLKIEILLRGLKTCVCYCIFIG